MRRRALLAIAVAVIGLGIPADSPWRHVEAADAASRVTTAREAFLGLLQAANSSVSLARLNPLSLRPVSRRVQVGEYHAAWSLSPDASQLALARGGQGIGVQIVALEAMKSVRGLQTGVAAEALGWLAPRRLVAGLQRGGTVLVDPRTGRILRRWAGFSFPDASARIRDGLVMLLPRFRRARLGLPLIRVAGTPRLAVVDAQGRLRSVTLARIRLGVRRTRSGFYEDRAGLAVDPEQERAYVFAADAPVARVDLRTMRVSYRRLESLDARPDEPQGSDAQPNADVLERRRSALWLGDGRVLIFGSDLVTRHGGDQTFIPAGAALVDTAQWSWRTVDASASGAAFAARRLVVYGRAWYAGASLGLRIYTLDGAGLLSLLDGERVFDVQVAADLAYVRASGAVYVIDVRSEKIVNQIVPPVDLVDVIVAP